jgi:site-specific recombinase XerD
MNYNLYLSSKRTNKKGLTPIYAKIGHLKSERSTNVWIDAKHWDSTYKRVDPDSPNAKHYNTELSKFEAIVANAQTIAEIDYALNPIHSVQLTKPNLVEVMDCMYEDFLEDASITTGTLRNYSNRIKSIKEWLRQRKQPKLCIESLDKVIAESFIKWMLSRGKSIAYIGQHIKLMKRAVEYAHIKFKTDKTTIALLTIKASKAKQVYLVPSELMQIHKKIIANTSLQKVRDLFLMQCYTGMAYIDLMKFERCLITDFNGIEFLRYDRNKTGNTGLLPLLPEAKKILEKYNYNLPHITNEAYNRFLKELALLCDIEVKLTSHVGRKTFGSLMLNRGASMESTTKMLGKTNVREVEQIYAEVHHQRLIMEMPELRQIALF